MTAAKTRAEVALVGLAVTIVLSGCASNTDATGDRASSPMPVPVPVPVPTSKSTLPATLRWQLPSATSSKSAAVAVRVLPPCKTPRSGFELSLVAGFRGAPDPVRAARSFVRHGAVAGFGSPSSVWVVTDPRQVRRGEVTLVDGSVSLDAIRLPNATWAIISGARCS